jgi:2-methylcitrate dehydratase PrpD
MYPTVATIHAAIEAFGKILDEHNIQADEISEVRVAVREYTIKHGAAIVIPSNVLGAQFSLAFSLALRAIKGSNDLYYYLDESLWTDPRITAIAEKVHAQADPDAIRDRTAGSRVTVETKDGRMLSRYIQYRKGTLQNPATREEFVAKFNSLAGSVLSAAERTEVIRTVEQVEELRTLRPLVHLIGGTPRFAEEQISPSAQTAAV